MALFGGAMLPVRVVRRGRPLIRGIPGGVRAVRLRLLDIAGVIRHREEDVASVSLEGQPSEMLGLIASVVVAGAKMGPRAVGVGDGVQPAAVEQLLVGGVTDDVVTELVISDDVAKEDELHSE